MAFTFIPMQAATYSNISRADTGRASALFSTQRQVGSAFGVAILATVWLSSTKARSRVAVGEAALRAARLHGFHDAFLAATLLSIVAALSALMIRNEDAAASLPSSFGKQHDEAVGAVMISR